MFSYTEHLVEYDNDLLMVYASGLTEDDYWEEYETFEEVDNPESFAEGYAARLRKDGAFVTVIPVDIEQDD